MAYRNGVWTRGTTNRNDRGSAESRRRRKLWLIETYGWPDPVNPFAGLVLCWRCDVPLTFEDITVDRWPIPGCDGGRYVQGNIRPCCEICNVEDGAGRRRSVDVDSVQV